jgi:hypothetical protein
MITTILACNTGNSDISSHWKKSEPISDSELHVKKGDCLTFKDSTGNYFIGMISSFNKSEGGVWYAICFTNYYDTILPNEKAIDTLKLNARRVGYYNPKDYIIGIDVTWARDTLIDKFNNNKLGQANVVLDGMEITAEGSVSAYPDFLNNYKFAKLQRLFPEMYDRDLLDSTFNPSFYLPIKDVNEAIISNENLKKRNR